MRRYRGYRRHQRRPGRTRGAGLYRSRRGVILGVCRGLAEYFDISVFWVRVIAVGALVFTGLWPVVGIYLLAAVIMKPGPVAPLDSANDEEFYNSYTASRSMALDRLKRTFDHLDRRLRRMEDTVTTHEYDWERRLNQTK